MNRKVTVVGGAGNVGATVARGVAEKQLADVVVIDIADKKAAGVALDILEACPVYGSDARVMGSGDYADSANSDIVVVTSGVPRKPGMSRDDLLNVNYKIMQQVTEQVVKYSPNCIIIPVSNPLDAMAQAVLKLSKFPRERVIGMAGVLDSARMRSFIAKELNVSVENIHAFVRSVHRARLENVERHTGGLLVGDVDDDDVGQLFLRDAARDRRADVSCSADDCDFAIHGCLLLFRSIIGGRGVFLLEAREVPMTRASREAEFPFDLIRRRERVVMGEWNPARLDVEDGLLLYEYTLE